MKKNLIFILFILCTGPLSALEFGVSAKVDSSTPITQMFVIGERSSGTNYMSALMLRNFYVDEIRVGHKHFPPWYDLPEDDYKENSRYYTFNDTENILFIVIFRNPYDWLRSMHFYPHHADRSLKNLTFSTYIRQPWKINPNDTTNLKILCSWDKYVDLNPMTGEQFPNVLALREAKIRNMLKIRNKASNVYYINYEKARDYPQEVVKEISALFPISPKPVFSPITNYVGPSKANDKIGNYKPRQYAPISKEDLTFINSQLDWKLEEKIGYTQKNSVN